MNIITCILCFAAGMAMDAFYNHRKQTAEADAYMRGYKNAKNEEQFYKNGMMEGKVQEMMRQPAPRHAKPNIDESFMNSLHQNGRAIAKIQ